MENGDTESIVKTLTSQPSLQELKDVLRQFEPYASAPTPSTASVIFAIVSTTIPELWRSLTTTESKEVKILIISCLSCIGGVNALLMRMDQVHRQLQRSSTEKEKVLLEETLEVLCLILEGDKLSPSKMITSFMEDGMRGKMLFNEYVALVGGSKILNVVSKVCVSLERKEVWAADGKKYSKWLGEEIGKAVKTYSNTEELSTLLGKGLSI